VDATNSGCTTGSRTAVSATINSNPTISISVTESSGTANDGTLCSSGASATITASGGTTYSWAGGPATAAYAVNPSSTTSYTVTGTSSGCTATASTTLTVLGSSSIFYSKSSGNLDVLTNWGTNSDGTGCNPANFTTSGITYIIQNNATPTTSGTGWDVSGTGSIVKVGNSSSNITFIAGGNLSFSCDLEITGNATLNLNDKNLTLSGDFVRSASTASFSPGSGTSSVVTFSGGANQFVNVTAIDTGNPAASDISFNDVTITGTDVRMYYDNNNNKKVNIRNLTVNPSGVLKFFSNP
jgi:hypothetical protein